MAGTAPLGVARVPTKRAKAASRVPTMAASGRPAARAAALASISISAVKAP